MKLSNAIAARSARYLAQLAFYESWTFVPKVGKAVLYPLEELDRWDRRSLIVCRPFRSLLVDEINE